MAFAIVIGAGIAVSAGSSLAAGAGGLVYSVRKKMKHATSIANTTNLSQGAHISLKNKGNLPFSHAIVVQTVEKPEDKVRVVYHIGSKSSSRVKFMEVDLHMQALNRELDMHQYETSISYPAEAVVDRAKSLCSQFVSPDQREVVRMYWPFFRDDEHFANWCQIGFSLRDGMKAAVAANYTKTRVSDLATVSEGNYTGRWYAVKMLWSVEAEFVVYAKISPES